MSREEIRLEILKLVVKGIHTPTDIVNCAKVYEQYVVGNPEPLKKQDKLIANK